MCLPLKQYTVYHLLVLISIFPVIEIIHIQDFKLSLRTWIHTKNTK